MIEIDPGQLRHRLALQSPTKGQDAYGAPTQTAWTTYATVWGEVIPVSASEKMAAEIVNPLVTHSMTIRRRSGVQADHRILYNGRTFQIDGIYDMEEEREYQRIETIERIA